MKYSLSIICAFLSFLSISQEVKSLDAKSFNNEMALLGKKMNAELVSCKFKKEVFKDINSSIAIESNTGEIIRGKGLEYKMVNPGMISFQTNNLNVVVDSLDKIVYISNVDSSMRQVAQMQQIPLDALKDYKLEKVIFPNYYILKAAPKNATIGTMEFYVHSKTTELYKLNIFYPPGNYFSEALEDETIESPYLTIIFEPMKKLKETSGLISLDNILEKNASGDYALSPKMEGFQLKDTRYKYKSTK
jgi:hypothetical protein